MFYANVLIHNVPSANSRIITDRVLNDTLNVEFCGGNAGVIIGIK